jgi:predicted ArsR family transcriptional regulator
MPTTTNRTVGRPRAVVKLPRKRQFTVSDVIDINALSPLTVRNYLNDLLAAGKLAQSTTKNKAGQRGRPRYVYIQ